MASIIKHSPVIQTVVQTVQGECIVKIALEINVNLKGDVDIQEKENEQWAIPDFSSEEIVKFGKVEE